MILSGLVLIAFAVYFLAISILTKEKDYFYLISSCLFTCLGLLCFYNAIPFDTIEIYDDSIEITPFYGKKKMILRNEIKHLNSYYPTTIARHVKIGTLVLKITSHDTVYKINESYYENFEAMHREIKKSKIKLTTQYEYFGSSQSRMDSFIILVCVLFFLAIILYQQLSK